MHILISFISSGHHIVVELLFNFRSNNESREENNN